MTIFAIIIFIGTAISAFFFRKGGYYNPIMQESNEPLNAPIPNQKPETATISNLVETMPCEVPVAPEKLLWDTVPNTRHSCRVIMDTYGFDWKTKDLLCAVIMSESGMKIRAINHNKNGSYDYGLVQMNSTYWVGKGKYFESEQEVYDHPEKSVKFLCDSYLEGKLNRWYGYTNKSYLKYLA